MLTLLSRRSWISSDEKATVGKLRLVAESISRQLRAWADSLQNSEITGNRHLNAKSRSKFRSAARDLEGK
jgi:hypothetical protein